LEKLGAQRPEAAGDWQHFSVVNGVVIVLGVA
jgi:hypothetical protein